MRRQHQPSGRRRRLREIAVAKPIRDHRLAALPILAALALAATGAAAQEAGKPDPATGVYPESGYRLPLPRREALDPTGQAIFDRVLAANSGAAAGRGASGPGAGLKGPLGIRLYSPRFAELGEQTNTFLRFQAGLDGRTRELAILVVARETDCDTEWAGHEPLARREGAPEAAIAAIRDRKPTAGLDPHDALVIDLAREAIVQHKVSLATYRKALDAFGTEKLVNLTGLIGDYLATSVLLTTFGAGPAPGVPRISELGR
jgi:4-carboxymuconolactone decarboxylase